MAGKILNSALGVGWNEERGEEERQKDPSFHCLLLSLGQDMLFQSYSVLTLVSRLTTALMHYLFSPPLSLVA